MGFHITDMQLNVLFHTCQTSGNIDADRDGKTGADVSDEQ